MINCVSNIRYTENKITPNTQYKVYRKNPKIRIRIPHMSMIKVKANRNPPMKVKSVLVVIAYIVRATETEAVRAAAVNTILGGLNEVTVATMYPSHAVQIKSRM